MFPPGSQEGAGKAGRENMPDAGRAGAGAGLGKPWKPQQGFTFHRASGLRASEQQSAGGKSLLGVIQVESLVAGWG